jgi:hypothetical protein
LEETLGDYTKWVAFMTIIPKKSHTMRQKIQAALTLSKVLSMPFPAGNGKRMNELHDIAKELKCFSKTIRTGTRYNVVIIDSSREMELI